MGSPLANLRLVQALGGSPGGQSVLLPSSCQCWQIEERFVSLDALFILLEFPIGNVGCIEQPRHGQSILAYLHYSVVPAGGTTHTTFGSSVYRLPSNLHLLLIETKTIPLV